MPDSQIVSPGIRKHSSNRLPEKGNTFKITNTAIKGSPLHHPHCPTVLKATAGKATKVIDDNIVAKMLQPQPTGNFLSTSEEIFRRLIFEQHKHRFQPSHQGK